MAPKKKKSKPRKKTTSKASPKSKSQKAGTGKAKGKEAHPSKELKKDSIAETIVERSIPIGMPVSKEKYAEMKKKAGKQDE